MSLEKADRIALVQYRIKQAKDTVLDVQYQLDGNRLNTAMNRIYYGMFYMLTALALLYKFETSKHQQLIGWFNKEFIKTLIFDKKYSKYIQEAFDYRQKSDYEPFINLDINETASLFEKMIDFISTLEKYISENQESILLDEGTI